jgi:hypothetical protein
LLFGLHISYLASSAHAPEEDTGRFVDESIFKYNPLRDIENSKQLGVKAFIEKQSMISARFISFSLWIGQKLALIVLR